MNSRWMIGGWLAVVLGCSRSGDHAAPGAARLVASEAVDSLSATQGARREPLKLSEIVPTTRTEQQMLGADTMVELQYPGLRESSGLARSQVEPHVLWTHNDSGDSPRLFAFSTDGTRLATLRAQGADADDWEDMASFAWEGEAYLLVGDIGGNVNRRHPVQLYLVREPGRGAIADGVQETAVPVLRRFTVKTAEEGGKLPDMEALAVDPADRSILLVEKTFPPTKGAESVADFVERTMTARVFSVAWPKSTDRDISGAANVVAQEIAQIHLPMVTSMDISPDGRRVLIGNYLNVHEWTRKHAEEPWAEVFRRPGRLVATLVGGKQYEALCYDQDGRSFFLTRELGAVVLENKGPQTLTPLFHLKLQ